MPTYEYVCSCGAEFERVLPVARYDEPQECQCGLNAKRIISKPVMVKVAPDILYTSPIDDRPITSWKKREEDLARSDCVPYDPDIKQDYQRRIDEGNKKIEKEFDATIESEIEKMPARKKELLESELKGNNVDVVRQTANAKPIKTDIVHTP